MEWQLLRWKRSACGLHGSVTAQNQDERNVFCIERVRKTVERDERIDIYIYICQKERDRERERGRQ